MTNKQIQEAITGANREKEILTEKLVKFDSSHGAIQLHGQIQKRLTELDDYILKLLQKDN